MSITERVQSVIDRFNKYDDWEDKYKELIKFGKNLDELEEKFWIDKFKIKGCQSQVWLRPAYQNGCVIFQAASDAVLVKGIIALITEVYSDSTPDEILTLKADFLKQIGITDHLSMNRTNGLASMLKQVHMYAMVFKSLSDKGVKDADPFS